MEGIGINTEITEWNQYYRDVMADYREMKEIYPFSCLTILPTVHEEIASARVIAASKDLIYKARAVEEDFLGEYSRQLYIEIPYDYREIGCKVYGAGWVDLKKLREDEIHFSINERLPDYGYELCVGTPESFTLMKNVILENVKTAENMLIAYEKVMTGATERLNLIAYAHGDAGRKQFQNNNRKYISRR